MLPVIPNQINRFIQDRNGQLSTFPFPPNLIAQPWMTIDLQRRIYRWMLQNYIWPYIQERKQFEDKWNKLLEMARATWKFDRLDLSKETRASREQQKRAIETGTPTERIRVGDTIIFDAIDRLTNLNHFISFKEKLPVQYSIAEDVIHPFENDVYHPSEDMVKAANALLKWQARQANFFRNYWILERHHYTYGISFANSEFEFKIQPMMRRNENTPDRSGFQQQLELTKCFTTFQPLSIRKLWLDYRLTAYDMEYQPCPFFFEEMPKFAIIANQYNPQLNPLGFLNTDKLPKGQWLFSGAETESLQDAYEVNQRNETNSATLTSLVPPEFAVQLMWTFYPMLPLDPQSGQFDEDGTRGIPLKRFVVQTFGNNLALGEQAFIRFQENYYPHDSLPIYGSAHMPDLDSGLYSPAIGDILENHYIQITTALAQFLENKDWINDPPHTILAGSPALNADINKKGVKIEVNSQNDIHRREPYDATGTTMAFASERREQAQTSSKAVDAILGKAMGSRTSATEASNAYQAAMSGVTTDINMLNHDISGQYATKVWEYSGLWIDPEILRAITGQFGFVIKPEHFAIRLDLTYDVGSTYIESIVRQGNLRYILESSRMNPAINQAPLWRMLLNEWKFPNADEIVNDQGLDDAIKISTDQAIRAYMGDLVQISPDQNHQIAIKVKTSFLEDRESYWNTNPKYQINAQIVIQQIETHQKFMQLQMLEQMMQMQAHAQMMGGLQQLQNPNAGQANQLPDVSAPQSPPNQAGQVTQSQGAA